MKNYTVEFMVEDSQEYISDMPYKVVDSYYSGELNSGYEIYRVETDDIKKIRLQDKRTYEEWIPDQWKSFKEDGKIMYIVTVWEILE